MSDLKITLYKTEMQRIIKELAPMNAGALLAPDNAFIWFVAACGKLRAYQRSRDGECLMRLDIRDSDFEGTGQLSVPIAQLKPASTASEVTIRAAGGVTAIQVTGSPARSMPACTSELDIPPPITNAPAMRIDSNDMAEAFRDGVHVLPKEDRRAYIKGALLDVRGSQVRVVSADGPRICVTDLYAHGYDSEVKLLIPQTAAKALRYMRGDSHTLIEHNRTRADFYQSGKALLCQRMQVKYASYERVLTASAHTATLSRLELRSVLKNIMLLTDPKQKSIEVTFDAGNVKVDTVGGTGMAARLSADCAMGSPVVIRLHAPYISQALMHIKGKYAQIAFTGPNDIVALRSTGNAHTTHWIMPMRS